MQSISGKTVPSHILAYTFEFVRLSVPIFTIDAIDTPLRFSPCGQRSLPSPGFRARTADKVFK